MEQRQFDYIRPDSGTWRTTRLADQLELIQFLARLKYGLLSEQFSKDTAVNER